MKQKLNKVFALISLIIILCNSRLVANANEQINEPNKSESENYDAFLIATGTPETILASFTDFQKKFIVEHLSENAVYEFSESCIENFDTTNSGISSLSLSALPNDQIQLTITCYSIAFHGTIRYAMFPSFKWLKTGIGIRNDSFAFALYSGWEVAPDSTASMTTYLSNSNGTQQVLPEPYSPVDISQYGYAFSIPTGDGMAVPNGYYEGHAVFYANKKDTNATNAIVMKYVHDSSSLATIGYGITIAGVASISVSSSNSKLQVCAQSVSFSL